MDTMTILFALAALAVSFFSLGYVICQWTNNREYAKHKQLFDCKPHGPSEMTKWYLMDVETEHLRHPFDAKYTPPR
jgi:hypothetical protein